MRDSILDPGDIGLLLLHARLTHGLLQRGEILSPISSFLWLLPCDPSFHPVVEPPKDPPDAGGHHPCLQAKYQDGLYNGQVETSRHQHIHVLPPKYPLQKVPALVLLLEVVNEFRAVIIHHGKDPP